MTEQVFVARERELSQLQTFLNRALAGQGTVSFVTGEAGAGKTALVTEFARGAQGSYPDLLVAIGQGDAQTGAGDAYLPFREILGLLTGDVEAMPTQAAITQEYVGRLQDFLRFSGQALVEYGPDLIDILVPGAALASRVGARLAHRAGWADRLDALMQRKAQTSAGQGTELDQDQIFEQYTKVLQVLAAKRPLMLVLDDLHWVDAGSVELLFRLGRRIEESRILIVGIYRPDDVALGRRGKRHPLEPVLNELKRYLGDIWVDLGQTEEAEGRQFVDALLDTEPNRLGEAFRQALYQRTHGHPLFTVELLRNLRERGDLVQDEDDRWVEGPALDWDTLPAGTEGVLEERIGRLEDELREALTIASVEGEDFTAQVVARVQAADERGLVRRLSRELVKQHRLVSVMGTQRLGRQRLSLYRFRHNLFQRYLYNSLDEVERAYLHEDVGNVLEELYGDQAEEVAIQLARHFLEAGVEEKALKYLLLAGDRARHDYAHAEAADFYGRAAEIAQRLGDVGALRRIYEGLGDAYSVAGENERAIENYQQALELYTEPRVRADLYNRIGWVYHMNARDLERGLEAYEQGLQELGENTEAVEVARIHINLGYFYMFGRSDFDLAKEHLDRSLALLEDTQHLSDLARTYAYLALYHNYREDFEPEQAIEYASRSIAMTGQVADDIAAELGYINLGTAYGYRQRQWEQALPPYQEALRMVVRRGRVLGLGHINDHLAKVYLALDQLKAADRHAQESFRAFERLGHPYARWGLCLQVVIRERQGKADEAEALLERAKTLSQDRPGTPYYTIASWIYAYIGDLDKALEWLERGRPFFDERHLEAVRTDPDLRLLWDHPRFIELMSGSTKGRG